MSHLLQKKDFFYRFLFQVFMVAIFCNIFKYLSFRYLCVSC